MKKQIMTLALAAIGIAATQSSFANSYTFYACEGGAFTLAMTNAADYNQYQWSDYANTTTLATTANYTPSSALATPSTAEMRQYLVRGKDTTAADCYSAWDTITVYLLPAPTVTITDEGTYCDNDFQSAIMTATAGALDFSALPSAPTFLDFDWTGSATGTASGVANNTYTGTDINGTYMVKLAYNTASFSANDGVKVGCTGTDSHTLTAGTSTATPPVITIQ